jgi:hypothetical protein
LNAPLIIGVDFDNTIVCYDALFHKICRERSLIPPDVPVNKSHVRNYLRNAGREDDWTEIQGYVYGARMAEAAPFPGVKAFFRAARLAGFGVCIISHKTRHPYKGGEYDLHRAAWDWLEHQGFFDPGEVGLPRAGVFFEMTKPEKLARVALCGCTHFIDDLPEFLAEPDFPVTTRRVLFDPNNLHPGDGAFTRITSWIEAGELFSC